MTTWLEEIWAEREDVIYPALFGTLRGIFPIPHTRFETIGAEFDPRWLTIGVFESAPTPSRASWLYVTSGLSNPWDDEASPEEYVGYGCEFAIETSEQGEWPISLLHHLAAMQLSSIAERISMEPLSMGDRVALHGAIDRRESVLRRVLLSEPVTFPALLRQRCGIADWLFCTGITEEEKAYGASHGHDELVRHLRESGALPVTDPHRSSTVR